MARKYFTLLIREDGKWAPQFGDHDKQVVIEERDGSYRENLQHPVKAKDCKIITTTGKQAAIDAEVARLNDIERQREVGKQAAAAMADDLGQPDRLNIAGASPGASQVLADEWEPVQEQVPTTEELVAAVKQHAMNNYNGTEGWDFIVECWSDSDIIEAIGDATTAKQAIARVRRSSTALADQRSDICNA